ncbi:MULTISPECIES: chorismate mutase [Bacillus]|uniref:chorismate mutase n=1 Tax=Bacillus TaxID=1386 RepID=UPI000BB85CB1|nr:MULTISPECIES: chorismate mutase [Bacillus]
MIRGIRGATTINKNDEQEITVKTEQLLSEMIKTNDVQSDCVAQILISVTDDINASFPAKALRNFKGWDYVPVMCMKEINVPDALPLCIRIMMTVNTNLEQKQINHVYLNGATKLRPDLLKT